MPNKKHINKKRLINLFQDLVRIDSVTGDEDVIAEFVQNYVQKHKLADVVKQDDFGNIYLRRNAKGVGLFFSAHLDTVEPGKGIEPIEKDGYIVSKGPTILGADNKSSLACILEALHVMKESGDEHKQLECVFTRSEEVGNYGAVNFDYSLLQANKGYCFDLSEPIGAISTASPYYERFDLEIQGTSAHASRPEEAINALTTFNQILNQTEVGKLDDSSILNIGVVQSGTVRNTIPGKLICKGEIRSYKEKNLEKHKASFIKDVKNVVNKAGCEYTLNFVRENPGYKHDSEEALAYIQETESVIKKIKLKPKHVETWGVSDANIYNDNERLCINLGDGTEFTHSPQERIKISEMERLVTLMLELV